MAYATVCVLIDEGPDISPYLAWHPDYRGCMAQGETVKEALASLDEVREMIMDYDRENNLLVPQPKALASTVIINCAGPEWDWNG